MLLWRVIPRPPHPTDLLTTEAYVHFSKGEEGAWLLIDETAPPAANVIAVLRGPVEILAVRRLCEERLRGPYGSLFIFEHDGLRYAVTPHADRGGKLTLSIRGDDGSLSRVETEFAFPTPDR